MLKILIIVIIAAAIFALVYFSSDGNTAVAAFMAALAATLAFVGPYIVDLADSKEDGTEARQESTESDNAPLVIPDDTFDDASNESGEQDSSNKEDFEQSEQKKSPLPVKEKTSTLDTELRIDEIATVSMDVKSIEASEIENIGAQIDVYNGAITMEDQVDTYTFIPSVTGRYRFEISGLTNGTGNRVNLMIKNSGGGVVDSKNYGVPNGEGLTIKGMQAGETYLIQVQQYLGLDSYTLSIGNQKETLDITGYTLVKDSVQFKDQRNVYLFTPPITGRYRFEISDLTKGSSNTVNLLVLNSGGGEEGSTSYGIRNGEGLTIASMQAGQTYEVQVRQYSGYDTYSLNIGYQKEAVDITGYNMVADSIQYDDQKNIYYFTPAITGRYRFEISNLAKGSSNKVNLFVWNSRDGEEGFTSYGIGNGEGLTIKDMQAGETYQIQVRQYAGYDMYNLKVGLQKETVDITEYSSVSDSIQYTDQRNVYTFTPASSGKYRFEIQGLTEGSSNTVRVLVFNSRDGEEGSKSSITNGKALEVDGLQAGETYEVQVRYGDGYDSYKLITKKVDE